MPLTKAAQKRWETITIAVRDARGAAIIQRQKEIVDRYWDERRRQ